MTTPTDLRRGAHTLKETPPSGNISAPTGSLLLYADAGMDSDPHR
jgi:hypothetical protein